MTDEVTAFKRKIDQLLGGETEVILPLQQIQEMKTNDLYLLERSMHFDGKPIEIRSIIDRNSSDDNRDDLSARSTREAQSREGTA